MQTWIKRSMAEAIMTLEALGRLEAACALFRIREYLITEDSHIFYHPGTYDILESIYSVAYTDDVCTVLRQVRDEFGADHCAIFMDDQSTSLRPVLLATYPQSSLEEYAAYVCGTGNPLLEFARETQTDFFWHDVAITDAKFQKFLNGIGSSGCSCVIPLSDNSLAVLSLSSAHDEQMLHKMLKDRTGDLRVIARALVGALQNAICSERRWAQKVPDVSTPEQRIAQTAISTLTADSENSRPSSETSLRIPEGRTWNRHLMAAE